MKVSKNVWLLPFLFIVVHICYIGCCKCVTDLKGKPYRQITTLRAEENGYSSAYSRDTVFINDSLHIAINISYEYIARNKSNPFNNFVNKSYAIDCFCSNLADSGYKYKIDSLAITSNKNFLNYSAGNNLISLFKGVYYSYPSFTRYNNLPITVLLDSLNNTKNYNEILLTLRNAIPSIKDQRFKYTIYTHGRSIETTSNRLLLWQ